MKTRKLAFALAVAALIALAVPAAAMANYSIHGNYTTDTDACAGCHRAHTSYSSVTWTDSNLEDQSALLIGATSEIWEFCYVCHGADAPGAFTNVEDGVYEDTDSTNGTYGEILNGGGFGRPGYEDGTWTSTHMSTGEWGAYGGGLTGMDVANVVYGTSWDVGTGPGIDMDCGSCHDPHGTPNYRILKSELVINDSATAYPVEVGGYEDSGDPLDPNPYPFVVSSETGFPEGGFRLHTAYPAYDPDYTTPRYAKGYEFTYAGLAVSSSTTDSARGMSGWCAGCHTQYISEESTYMAGEWVGGTESNFMLRHRHPMNVELENYKGPDEVMMDGVVADGSNFVTMTPVAHDFSEAGLAAAEESDWIECLSCHRAHGTNATMEGFASKTGMESLVDETGMMTNPPIASTSVDENSTSALLRMNNRGVCESCHNK